MVASKDSGDRQNDPPQGDAAQVKLGGNRPDPHKLPRIGRDALEENAEEKNGFNHGDQYPPSQECKESVARKNGRGCSENLNHSINRNPAEQ